MTTLRVLRPLSIVVLMLLISYVVADSTGVFDYFNKMVNQEDGWKKEPTGYSRTYIETSYRINVSFLKDPKASSLQVFQGAMKKAAVDRMELVTIKIIRVNDLNSISEKIIKLTEKYKCNTAIINGYSEHRIARSEAFAM